MSVAIMQPYMFPYLGYFQLIQSVDTFVFYDDVNFINKGFINRNSILVKGNAQAFTIPLKEASQNKLIKEIDILKDGIWLNKFLKTIDYNYKKAPYFKETRNLILETFNQNEIKISELAIQSVKQVCNYLNIDKTFQVSSEMYNNSKGLEKQERLISIIAQSRNNHYINPQGGKALYDKDYFASNNIKLSFIENQLVTYKQFNLVFIKDLSIIDVLMFNSKESIRELLNQYILS